jgi:hypothetical protein
MGKRMSMRWGKSARGAVVTAKPEPLAGKESNRVVTARLLPLHPLHCAVVFFHADEHTPLLFTDFYALARGH